MIGRLDYLGILPLDGGFTAAFTIAAQVLLKSLKFARKFVKLDLLSVLTQFQPVAYKEIEETLQQLFHVLFERGKLFPGNISYGLFVFRLFLDQVID